MFKTRQGKQITQETELYNNCEAAQIYIKKRDF